MSELQKRANRSNAAKGWTQRRREKMSKLNRDHGFFSNVMLSEDTEMYQKISHILIEELGDKLSAEEALLVNSIASNVVKLVHFEEIYGTTLREKRNRNRLGTEKTIKHFLDLSEYQRSLELRIFKSFKRLGELRPSEDTENRITRGFASVGLFFVIPDEVSANQRLLKD